MNGTPRRKCDSHALAARLAESTDPKVQKHWRAYVEGRHRSVTAAARAAGLVKDSNDPLKRLKENWKKATPEQRAEFLLFIEQEG